jgi:hypothetical protein
MTGQTLLDMMEMVNQELQLQSGESDVTRGLLALNVAQDYFENLAAVRKLKTGSTSPTTEISAASGSETTAFPAGFIRIDRIQRLSASGGVVVGDLDPIERTGGHAPATSVPWLFTQQASTGTPGGYWTQGTSIYWSPKPSQTTYFRVYGFPRAADITAGGTFTYDDGVAFPLAAFATKVLSMGVADSVADLAALANDVFEAVLNTLELFKRDNGHDLTYSRVHTE